MQILGLVRRQHVLSHVGGAALQGGAHQALVARAGLDDAGGHEGADGLGDTSSGLDESVIVQLYK